MGMMSIREFNANISKALAIAEQGDDLLLTRNGKPVLRITAEGVDDVETKRQAAVARLLAMMDKGIPGFHGPLSYEERTGR